MFMHICAVIWYCIICSVDLREPRQVKGLYAFIILGFFCLSILSRKAYYMNLQAFQKQ